MMIYSHFITSSAAVYTFDRIRMPAFVDEAQYKVCEKCPTQKWKPLRSHHCSVCEQCVTKMDHHCPLAMHCIGDRNHKSFILMVGYHFLGTTFWCFCFINYASNSLMNDIKVQKNLIIRSCLCTLGFLDTLTVFMFVMVCIQ